MAEPSEKSGDHAATTHLAAGTRRAALGFIFAAALMDILALGIIIPVLPNLVKHFTNGDTAEAAHYVGWFGLIFGAMQFVFSPIMGALSDRFGRRPVLLISIFGLGFDYVIMALAPSIHWLFVGRTLSGITAASFSTANAYVADITPPDKRAKSFGFMGAAFGIGFVIGPAMGGFLGGIDLRLPFWVAAGLAMLNGIYGLFVLPESLPKERRARFNPAKANPVGSFMLPRQAPSRAPLRLLASRRSSFFTSCSPSGAAKSHLRCPLMQDDTATAGGPRWSASTPHGRGHRAASSWSRRSLSGRSSGVLASEGRCIRA